MRRTAWVLVVAGVLAISWLLLLPSTPDDMPSSGAPQAASTSTRPSPPQEPAIRAPTVPLVLPDEPVPEKRPDRVMAGSTHYTKETLTKLYELYAVPGPAMAYFAEPDREKALAMGMAEQRLEIQREPQMRNLRGLSTALTEVYMVASHSGLVATEQVIGERLAPLRGLGMDGSVPPQQVAEQGCALAHVEGPCLTPDMCAAVARFEGIAASICADPMAPPPAELQRDTATRFVIPRSELGL